MAEITLTTGRHLWYVFLGFQGLELLDLICIGHGWSKYVTPATIFKTKRSSYARR